VAVVVKLAAAVAVLADIYISKIYF